MMIEAATLAELRGRAQRAVPLADSTWFRVGGPAEMLVRPADIDDLRHLLVALPLVVPVHVVGACSNLIIRDGGLAGVTIRLTRGFGQITLADDGVIAGAAALDATVAKIAARAGLGGLEFLSGIPGTIGGAVATNAGAYGGDVASSLVWVDVVTRTGDLTRLFAPELTFSYRYAHLPGGAVVVRAHFRAHPSRASHIIARMAEIQSIREATQPVRSRTGGSTFRNPPGGASAIKAWELIDAAGCRGLACGGAQISNKHCNFLINTGTATAADLESLGEEVRERVRATSGVTLDWEIHRIGLPAHLPQAAP
jgi:UDP-N-acetylmuramate dehydrogenase